MWLYAVTGLLFDLVISVILQTYLYKSIVVNVFLIAEFLFISTYYKRNLGVSSKKYINAVIVALSALFVAANLLKTDFGNIAKGINLSGALVFFIAYIVYAITGFYLIIKEQKVIYIERSAFFWANVAFIIYGSGMFFLILFFDFLEVSNRQVLLNIWQPITCTINIIEYLVLTFALTSEKAEASPWNC